LHSCRSTVDIVVDGLIALRRKLVNVLVYIENRNIAAAAAAVVGNM
jgi:hypothetical protein